MNRFLKSVTAATFVHQASHVKPRPLKAFFPQPSLLSPISKDEIFVRRSWLLLSMLLNHSVQSRCIWYYKIYLFFVPSVLYLYLYRTIVALKIVFVRAIGREKISNCCDCINRIMRYGIFDQIGYSSHCAAERG